jgi:hypothetical protein
VLAHRGSSDPDGVLGSSDDDGAQYGSSDLSGEATLRGGLSCCGRAAG